MASPPIDTTQSRYDLTTFSGRVKHFAEVTNPLTLLKSRQELKDAQALLEDYRAGERQDLYDKPNVVYKAKQLVDSSIHPDTGEPVPLPFRMSAFVPTNIVACGFMLMPGLSTTGIVLSQWFNQSLNSAVNYCNANKSSPLSSSELATAYLSATTTSVALAVGLNSSVGRLRSLSPASQAMARRFVPFVAVVAAGAVNVSLMRYKELFEGIPVRPPSSPDEAKQDSLGNSAVAGRLAVSQTIASRILINVPTLILPPAVLAMLHNRGFFRGRAGKRQEILTNLGLIATSLLVALPPAVAFFPQTGSIDPNRLEAAFHNVKDPKTGEPLSVVQFSKGL